MTGTITYTYDEPGAQPITLPIGHQRGVEREGACLDLHLTREVAHNCPLTVVVLIRTTGEIALWETRWTTGEGNTYWHFGSEPRHPVTDAQRATLERMFLNLEPMPGGLGSALGGPVTRLMRGGSSLDAIAARHGAPAPYLA